MFEKLLRKALREELNALGLDKRTVAALNKLGAKAPKEVKGASTKAAKPAKVAAAPKATKGTTKKVAKSSGSWEGSKSDFIRSMPDSTPRQIMDAAKAIGLVLVPSQIYGVRAADAKSPPKKKVAKAAAAPKAAPAKVAAPAEATPPAEAQPKDVQELIGVIKKVLKKDTLSVKAIFEGLTKRKVKITASQPIVYLGYLLDTHKDHFTRAGNSRYRQADKAPKVKAPTAAATAKAPKAAKAAPVAAAEGSSERGAMSRFVREKLAQGLKPKEIVDAGNAAGLPVKAGLVYSVQNTLNKEKGSSPKADRVAAPSPKAADPAPTQAAAPVENVSVVSASAPPPAVKVDTRTDEERGFKFIDPNAPLDLSILSQVDEEEDPNPFAGLDLPAV